MIKQTQSGLSLSRLLFTRYARLTKIYSLSKSSVGISLNSKSKYKYEKYIILIVIRIYYHVLKFFIIC